MNLEAYILLLDHVRDEYDPTSLEFAAGTPACEAITALLNSMPLLKPCHEDDGINWRASPVGGRPAINHNVLVAWEHGHGVTLWVDKDFRKVEAYAKHEGYKLLPDDTGAGPFRLRRGA